ncbi:hypothetical protein [uncultured Pseudoteredinibacter sp.]|uniref:hypothetical protein n=1 Tax=uncultured Pseudoteredinibacter sp. TaxID=1641701 RepID=UPI0026259B8F|nr:hypothetical protein [uncultured Pseudoteredinibacter sp.]
MGNKNSLLKKGPNSTFRGGDNTHLNACVGENGLPGYHEYSKGYSTAALALIEQATRDPHLSIDHLVYPICFSIRHSVELRLKHAIKRLEKLYQLWAILTKDPTLGFKYESTHNLSNIWLFLKKHAGAFRNEFCSYLDPIDYLISNISQVDQTGQVFRYPMNQANRRHLSSISLINLEVLKQDFERLDRGLVELEDYIETLIAEYQLSTFTRHMARRDLCELADSLPKLEDWSNYKDLKPILQKKFGISSNEIGKSIDKIKRNRFLASKLGIENPLLGLQDRTLIRLCKKISEINNGDGTTNYRIASSQQLGITAAIEANINREEVIINVSRTLTNEEIAGIHSLYYLGQGALECEHYESLYESELELLKKSDRPIEKAIHVLKKTNFIYCVEHALDQIGRSPLKVEIAQNNKPKATYTR